MADTTITTTAPRSGKVSFFDLNDARNILDELLLELDGEETVDIAQLWDQLQGDASAKAIAWGKWLRERKLETKMLDGQIAALKDEIARLASERTAIDHLYDRSKAELERQMQLFGLEKAKQPGCSLWFQESPKLDGELDEETLRELMVIEPTLVRYTPATFALDRVAALAYVKAGQEIAGLTLNPNASLRIR